MAPRTRAETRERVLTWEETISRDSELYSRLAHCVADDDRILDLISVVPPGQLEMNMLLAAVQYLLLLDRDAPLARWYPSLGGERTDARLEATFSGFVVERQDEIAELITTRRVQTNEVARCVFLLPAYNLVQRLGGAPLAIIEVGTSAGLNQNVDRYGYSYQSEAEVRTLNADSPVRLATDCGESVPETADGVPRIASRVGLDLHPIDVTDTEQARWLQSLVWPDQVPKRRYICANSSPM